MGLWRVLSSWAVWENSSQIRKIYLLIGSVAVSIGTFITSYFFESILFSLIGTAFFVAVVMSISFIILYYWQRSLGAINEPGE